MSGEFLIVEKYVAGRNPDDQVYISLSSDVESSLVRVDLQTITVTESLSTGSPICVMNFIDGNSRLMSDAKLDYAATFYLVIGNNPLQSSVTLPLKLSSIQFTNEGSQGSSQTQNVSFSLTFIHSGWDKIINEKKSRSWGGVKYSEVVKQIASECEYTSVDVEESDAQRESIIQPYLSNLGMFRYIQERAKSKKFDDIYEFGVDIGGRFFFKTMSGLIDEQKASALSNEIPTISLKPGETKFTERKRGKKENQDVPETFFTFRGRENYTDNTTAGGGGSSATYYDFETGTYINREVVYRDFKSYQMTDFTPVKKIHEDTKTLMYYGSNSEFENVAKADVSNIINAYSPFEISMDGNVAVSIGRLVELIFPTPANTFSSAPYSEVYSGFYVVVGVTHQFDMGLNSYITTLKLFRNGFNGKFLNGYSKTKLGKFTK